MITEISVLFIKVLTFTKLHRPITQLLKITLLHIGSFEKRKDLITLVKAFRLVDDSNLKLVLAGAQIINGNSEVLDEIKTFILQNKLRRVK